MSEDLLYACIDNNIKEVKRLLKSEDKKIDINYQKENGQTALAYACYWGHLNIVKYLLTSNELKNHASVHLKNNSGENCFMLACEMGHLKIVKYLLTAPKLKEHVDIHLHDEYGYNALIKASQRGHLEVVKYLILEKNYQINKNTMTYLTAYNKSEELFLIQSRDLYQKMNDNLSANKNIIKARKI